MDCNKDEALRAKDLAESKMQNRDFLAARKIVIKAQQLYPDLENISQMLTVCEVHISAATKINGELDWYCILQVESKADEQAIKKQFRKLALLLHPDKNKFAGAEAAFKLIKEAHMILSDKGKRSLHDMKRGANVSYFQARQPPPQAAKKQSGVTVNVTTSSVHFNGLNQQQPSSFSNPQTFWTLCPNCNTRYQYYKTILDKHIRCHSCLHSYVAYDMNAQLRNTGSGSGVSHNHSGAHYHAFPGQNVTTDAQQKFSAPTAAASNTRFQGNIGRGSSVREPLSKSTSANKAKEPVKLSTEEGERQKAKPPASNARRKRAKLEDDESSFDSDDSGSSDSEDSTTKKYNSAETNSWTNGNSKLRRSTRQKQHTSYNEGDDDTGTHSTSKRSRTDDLAGHVDHCDRSEGVVNEGNGWPWKSAKVEDKQNIKHDEHPPEGNLPSGRETVDTDKVHGTEQKWMSENQIPTWGPSPSTNEYPDPEFYDFDQNRNPKFFAVGQIWALYDDSGEMPRYYAKIRSVSSPHFRVRYTWLEYDPTEETDSAWYEAGLAVACGKYKLGETDYSNDIVIFSHIMAWKGGSKKNTYEIYPRKGEVWALFKDWDIRWCFNAENHEPYNYELVEVLSDLTGGSDIIVTQLLKIAGFVSLFTQAGKNASPLRIPRSEVLRFSHMVPSYKLSGNEREGVPGGCFELDAMSLPKNFGETCPSIALDSISTLFEGTSSKAANFKEQNGATKANKLELNKNEKGREEENVGVIDHSPDREDVLSGKEYIEVSSDLHAHSEAYACVEDESVVRKVKLDVTDIDHGSEPKCFKYDYPESEFYDFEEERFEQKFERGQIWALYSDIDKYPNFYGLIKKVKHEDFSVKLVWLEACPLQEGESEWIRKGLPYGCGIFKVMQESQTFDSTAPFSHLVNATPGRKERYDFYPKDGEIWAIFKEWNMQWTRADLDKCEYDLVEIVKQTGSGITYSALTRVDGYKTIFMPDMKRRSLGVVEVPMTERLRFSHQVPAFRLTEEKGGKLRGFWELDPASVPELLLCTD